MAHRFKNNGDNRGKTVPSVTTQWKRGNHNGGREPGSRNKITRDVRENIMVAYDRAGGAEAFISWLVQTRSTTLYPFLLSQAARSGTPFIGAQTVMNQVFLSEKEYEDAIRARGMVLTERLAPPPEDYRDIDARSTDSPPPSSER